MTTSSWQINVNRSDLARSEIVAGVDLDVELRENQALLAVDSYAMTANNITYAVMGEAMSYWNFFPTGEGWGVVPVWGFGVVVQSKHPEIAEGDRYYGYFPSASHLVVDVTKNSSKSFSDGAAHRLELPPVYSQYTATATDSSYSPDLEDVQSLLRPLFMTSFFIDDYLADNDLFGAERVLVSSASSKTSFALAYCLHRRGVSVVGLTSPANVEFVESLDWYSEVVTYDEIEKYADGGAVSFVDMAGNAEVRTKIHRGFSDLRHSLAVGATHWTELGASEQLPGPEPEFFFAPTQISKRGKEWGPGVTESRVADAWGEFSAKVAEFLKIEQRNGPEAAQAAYLGALDGSADPKVGVIVRP